MTESSEWETTGGLVYTIKSLGIGLLDGLQKHEIAVRGPHTTFSTITCMPMHIVISSIQHFQAVIFQLNEHLF